MSDHEPVNDDVDEKVGVYERRRLGGNGQRDE